MEPTAVRINASRLVRNIWSFNDAIMPRYAACSVYFDRLLDVTTLHEWRSAQDRPRPSWTSCVVRAAALTMQRNPDINRAILGFPGLRRLWQFTNNDVAVAIEKPLENEAVASATHVEIVRDADHMSVDEVTQCLSASAQSSPTDNPSWASFLKGMRSMPTPLIPLFARSVYWSVRLWQRYRGSACWVNSPTRFGVDRAQTLWPWPVTFTFGLVEARPMVVNGTVCSRMTMPVAMVFDRRINPGGPAARIFADFCHILAQPDSGLIPNLCMHENNTA